GEVAGEIDTGPVELVVEAIDQRRARGERLGQARRLGGGERLGARAHSTPSCCSRRNAIHPGSIGSQKRSSRARRAAATAGPASTPAQISASTSTASTAPSPSGVGASAAA